MPTERPDTPDWRPLMRDCSTNEPLQRLPFEYLVRLALSNLFTLLDIQGI